MSEPSQLFVQIRISKGAFDQFLLHKVVPPSQFGDWEDWLSTAEYYGDKITNETVDKFSRWGFAVGSWLRDWTEGKYTDSVINQYDEQTRTWTLAVTDFSENYREFIINLNVIRQIALFKDISSKDYVLIIPFFFGSGTETPEAVMEIAENSSVFISSVPEDIALIANSWFSRQADEQLD
ncbi:hypothetical protein [Leptolyngbya sp. PCC 6406]|uniref:hypothetical protein n=1 Tax=Leptolyngbya sp. PCC 6406 TaxID=1173264 RepID=UPI0002AC26E9|nr:hypothetical protein [Leptolyngbya sp. PCC 6406]